MARSRIAAALGILFIVLFCLSSVTGTATVKEVAATTQMTLPQLFFSLSSASILLIPLAIVTMIAAIVAQLAGQRNVGFMFSVVSFVAFGLFLILFSAEKLNAALYPSISEALKEAGVKKLKKRDVERIAVQFSPLAFAALASAGASACEALPSLRTDYDRRALHGDLQIGRAHV